MFRVLSFVPADAACSPYQQRRKPLPPAGDVIFEKKEMHKMENEKIVMTEEQETEKLRRRYFRNAVDRIYNDVTRFLALKFELRTSEDIHDNTCPMYKDTNQYFSRCFDLLLNRMDEAVEELQKTDKMMHLAHDADLEELQANIALLSDMGYWGC